MKPFRSGHSHKPPYFAPGQIDNMCCDELRAVGLLPASPEPIRIDRFIEKRFNVSPLLVRTTLVNKGELDREALTWGDKTSA